MEKVEAAIFDWHLAPYDNKLATDANYKRMIDYNMAPENIRIDRIRFAAPERVPYKLFKAAAETGFYIARSPVLMEGRIELLHYYRQQSICRTYHRYGNLGERSEEWEDR
jgi:hypothetical protein